ncbi:MAG: DUF1013 domain-containing protein [Kiloniellales bacterium]
MSQPLMPKATAVWLIDNTGLSFEQIAEFCSLHVLEVQGIADGEVAKGIQGLDPVMNNQLTKEEIVRCEQDTKRRLVMRKQDLPEPMKRTKGPRYTPVAKRQDKPDGVAFLLKHFPDLKDVQISKLIGTTKNTIQAIRERTHWNTQNIKPRDPVLLGLCTQTELNAAVAHAETLKAREVQKHAIQEAHDARDDSDPDEEPPVDAPDVSAAELPEGEEIAAEPPESEETKPADQA